jgi:hypothetical protein
VGNDRILSEIHRSFRLAREREACILAAGPHRMGPPWRAD